MAEVRSWQQWNLILTNEEFKLILRGMRGAYRDAADQQKGEDLCDRLSELRVSEVKAAATNIVHLEDNLSGKTKGNT
jgi:hypothetical protein